MDKIYYREEQKFRQTWVWVLLLASLLLPIIFLIIALAKAIQSDSDDVILLSFIMLFVLVIGIPLLWLFLKLSLVVEIRKEGIWFKFWTLLYKWKTIDKNDISSFEIRSYKPVVEYGGWGIKGNSKNRVYNVSGNKGLQVYLKNGKKVLFGTQKQQAIKAAMKRMMTE